MPYTWQRTFRRVCPECGHLFVTGNPKQVYDRTKCKKRAETRRGLERRTERGETERRDLAAMRADGHLCVTADSILDLHGERLVQAINDVLQGRKYFSAPHLNKYHRRGVDRLLRFKAAYQVSTDGRGRGRQR